MLSQNDRPVNTPIALDSLFDADARTIKNARGDRLALTKAQMITAAENRYGCEYEHARRHQGGVGYVDVLIPVEGPADGSRPSTPWVHLLPWTDTTYLIRAKAPNYGSPDWRESDNMREWLTAGREDTGGVMTETMP